MSEKQVEEALLPCPFCGEAPRVRRYRDEALSSHDIVWYTTVGCSNCDVQMTANERQDTSAVELWNDRAPSVVSGAVPSDAVTRTVYPIDGVQRIPCEEAAEAGLRKCRGLACQCVHDGIVMKEGVPLPAGLRPSSEARTELYSNALQRLARDAGEMVGRVQAALSVTDDELEASRG